MRHSLLLAVAALVTALPPAASRAQATTKAMPAPPPFVGRGLPGAGQAALKPLVGTWRVEKRFYAVLGTADKPVVSTDVTSHVEWVADGRFLREVVEGTVGGQPYWRMGLLGYSNMDRRYEWATVDKLNANMMSYRGPLTGMTGTFTDQGLLGEQTVGKSIPMRFLFRIESADRYVTELYFTPPNGREILVDRSIYTRSGSSRD